MVAVSLKKKLVESLATDFEPEQFVDEYQAELRTLIQAKLEQGDAVDTAATFGEQPEEAGGEVIDLMEALRQSIAAKREGGSKDAAKAGSKGSSGGSGGSKTAAKGSSASKS